MNIALIRFTFNNKILAAKSIAEDFQILNIVHLIKSSEVFFNEKINKSGSCDVRERLFNFLYYIIVVKE